MILLMAVVYVCGLRFLSSGSSHDTNLALFNLTSWIGCDRVLYEGYGCG